MAIPDELQERLDNYAQENQETKTAAEDSISVESQDDYVEHKDTVDTVEANEVDEKKKADDNFKRMEGRYKARIRQLEEERENALALANANTLLAQEVPTLRERIKELESNSTLESDDTLFTDDVLETYGDLANTVQSALSKQEAKHKKELEVLQQQQRQLNEQILKRDEANFNAQLRAAIPQIDTLTKDNLEWQDYINSTIPYTSISIYEALSHAHHNRDIKTIREIVGGFNQVNKSSEKGDLSALVTPNKVSANAPSGKRYLFKESDYETKKNQLFNREISSQEFMAFSKEYEQALKNGQVAP